jgi:hypothetical protein
MKLSALKGELAFTALFAAVGIYWTGSSLELPIWSGFAPDSGFLPLVYGILLTALSIGIGAMLLASQGEAAEREPLAKPLMILAGLAACVGAGSVVGFLVPLFAMMFFLYAYVERLPVLRAALVSAGTTAALVLVFEQWLQIPLPLTPWGF